MPWSLPDRNVTPWSLVSSRRMADRLSANVIYSHKTRPFDQIDPTSLSPTAAFALFEPWRDWEQRDCVSVFRGKAFIEPTAGWIVCSPGHLIENCLIDSSFAERPPFSKYLRTRLWPDGKILREPRIITLRDWGEVNYWHFLNDLIGGRLRLAEHCRLPNDIPLLLGRRAYDMPFVREFVEKTNLGGRRLLIQDEQYIQCEEVVFFETSRHSLRNVDFILDLLGLRSHVPTGSRRIFLTRRAASGRHIANNEAIMAVCRRFGFEVVMAEEMRLQTQIEVFSSARVLVAVHGAGLVNMIFRKGAPLSVLEIFPGPSYHGWDAPPPHYFWLAQALGFAYDAVFGNGATDGSYKGSFFVDPEALAARLSDLCRDESSREPIFWSRT